MHSLIYLFLFIYLFGVLRRFQHCTGHITTGSWKGRGNQYIEFARVVYCKLLTNGKQLPAFPLKAIMGIEPRPQRWEARVLPLCHRGPYAQFNDINNTYSTCGEQISLYIQLFLICPGFTLNRYVGNCSLGFLNHRFVMNLNELPAHWSLSNTIYHYQKAKNWEVVYHSGSGFIYLGFNVAFNTVQVISRRVVGRAEETST